jgi:PDZ domain-containing protein
LYEAPFGTRLTLTPGTALRVEDRVTLQPGLYGPRRPAGTILSLSVGVAPATFYYAALSHRDPAVDLVPRSVVYHHMTAAQSDAEDVKTNALSKAAATYLVLGRLGHPVEIAGGQPVVSYSPSGSPLHKGDRVIAVNGGPTPYIENLYSRLEAIDADLGGRPAGHQVDVVVSRPGGGTTHVKVALAAPRSVPTLPSLDHAEFISDPLRVGPSPYTVSIDTAGEGGSSAGLALTLGLLDALGPAPILRGGRMAVTGTVAPDGTVGPIGGLRQKVALAERSHATMLMVPCDQAKAARSLASDRLPVVGVRTVDEALATLAGGRPSCPTT